jgi:hypothetical protein|tara:strand:- start:11 stop:331 length:321 start_codon:yes stop_codon:yes gene_type:complete
MKLLTKEIKTKAKKQYNKSSDLESQKVVAKFFDPMGSWTWYLMNLGDDEDYAWGIVKGHEVEMGSFLISELESIRLPLGMRIERDKFWSPLVAKEVYDGLLEGKHF